MYEPDDWNIIPHNSFDRPTLSAWARHTFLVLVEFIYARPDIKCAFDLQPPQLPPAIIQWKWDGFGYIVRSSLWWCGPCLFISRFSTLFEAPASPRNKIRNGRGFRARIHFGNDDDDNVDHDDAIER